MRAVSSSESSSDDTDVPAFKAAQAEQYRTDNGAFKFKEAQVEALRADPLPRQSATKKPRANSIDYQTAASRTRSTQPQQQQTRKQTPMSAAQLLQFLATDNRETKDTRRLLHSALSQLDASSRRLAQSDAERRALESSQLAQAAQTLHTASALQQHAANAQAELSLYKLQMARAQEEIRRAQDAVRTLEAQRDDAEQAATRARAVARKLHTEKMSILAREEGRREGYETGFGHGRMIAAARAEQQRRIEAAEQRRRRRQIEVAPREAGGAFIEEEEDESEGVRGDRSRGVPDAEPQQRRRRESLGSARTTQPREPERIIIRDAQPRPASAMSTSTPSVRRVSAPLAGVESQNGNGNGRPPSERPASRASTVRGPAPASASAPTPTPPDRNGAATPRASRTSLGLPSGAPAPNNNSTYNVNNNNGQNARSSVASRASAAATTNNNLGQTARNSISSRARRRSTSTTFDLDSELGLGSEPRYAPVEAMMPRTIPMPPPMPMPPPLAPPPQPYFAPAQPTQHVPMPPPPRGAMSMSTPVPAPAQPQPQFEVERVGPSAGAVERRDRERSPSSVSTSLGTLRLTSFPATAPTAGSDRDRDGARELSVILEHAEGSPGGSQLGNGNGNGNAGAGAWYAPPRRQTPWGGQGPAQGQGTRGSSPYSDPRGMEEWRRGTDEEAPRNQLPPPSPLTSPGMLSPFDVRPTHANANMHGQPSQESFRTDLHRSSSGSSSHTVNITIVPPSRPTSIGLSAGPPTQGSGGGFLSPSHAEDTPVDEDDDDDDDEDDDSDAGLPPGFVISPLPAFAQGVTYPDGFVPMSVAPAPQPLPPFVPAGGPGPLGRPMGGGGGVSAGAGYSRPPSRPGSRQVGGGGAESGASTWTAPAPVGGMGYSRPPSRPLSRQIGGGGAESGASTWPAPAPVGAGTGDSRPPSRPPSRQIGGGGAQSGASTWAVPAPVGGGGFEPPPRPLSRQMGGIGGAAPAASWGAPSGPPGFVEQPPRPQSRQMGGILGAAPAPANATFGGDVPEPIPRPLSRQMGGILGNPGNSTWTAPPLIGANSMGPPQQQPTRPPSQMGGAADPNWTFGGTYTFGQNSTPRTQPPPPLGFPAPTVGNHLGMGPSVAVARTHAPQPTRPQSFVGTPADNQRPTTPRPIYADPAPGISGAFGTGYPAPTPARAAGFPLPSSVSASSPATTTPGQRTPAGYSGRSLSGAGDFRAPSRASSRANSAGGSGFARYNNNQTPNPNANLGITNPYTSITEEAGASGSSGSSGSSLELDPTTAHNTYANANANANIYNGGPVIPVIPPSPAHSYRPLR